MTNDFPPKVGGIQNYLWELWRRLDPERAAVYTTPYPQFSLPPWMPGSDRLNRLRSARCRPEPARSFDAASPVSITRSSSPVLLPVPGLADAVSCKAQELGCDFVLIDPALPLGAIGPQLDRPYGVVLHGAEAVIPARLPVADQALRRVLAGSRLTISAGQYALDAVGDALGESIDGVVIPPGVDHHRFRPADATTRLELRDRWGLTPDDVAVAVVTRLVPRKGIDILIDALDQLSWTHPNVCALIGGTGREAGRLAKHIAGTRARARLLGPLPDAAVVELYQASDVMAMPCCTRWRGLEQEGFGIVFLEAAAAGLPQIAGASGGAPEAVEDGRTGFVVEPSPAAVADRLALLADDPDLRTAMGAAARHRAVDDFDYDRLAHRLEAALDAVDLAPFLRPER